MSTTLDTTGHDVWDPRCVHGPHRVLSAFPPVGCLICRPAPPASSLLPAKSAFAEAILPSSRRSVA